jgi:uncharacterized membrane protein
MNLKIKSIISIVFLIFSLFVSYWASIYATKKQSNSVSDIILSNTPTYNVVNIFVYGIFILIAFVIFLAVIKPQRIPFMAESSAIFILIRSIFISLTHIGLYPNTIPANIEVLKGITSGGDLFFSGHTGFPFLMALIFWKNKFLRYLFLVFSIGFGAVSLLGHYHYTIDVLSAFFITFGIFHICVKIFKKDYNLLLNGTY